MINDESRMTNDERITNDESRITKVVAESIRHL
jgi:hypothetical protein